MDTTTPLALLSRLLPGATTAPASVLDFAAQAAARAGDEEVLALLAGRGDLGGVAHEVVSASSSMRVRCALLTRPGIQPAEVVQLLKDEKRATVLAAVAESAHGVNPVVLPMLEAALVARPTTRLAEALALRPIGVRATAAMLRTLGFGPRTRTIDRAIVSAITRLGSTGEGLGYLVDLIPAMRTNDQLGAAARCPLSTAGRMAVLDHIEAFRLTVAALSHAAPGLISGTSHRDVLVRVSALLDAALAEPRIRVYDARRLTGLRDEALAIVAAMDAGRVPVTGVEGSDSGVVAAGAEDDPAALLTASRGLVKASAKSGTTTVVQREAVSALVSNTATPAEALVLLLGAGLVVAEDVDALVAQACATPQAAVVDALFAAAPTASVRGGLLACEPDPQARIGQMFATAGERPNALVSAVADAGFTQHLPASALGEWLFPTDRACSSVLEFCDRHLGRDADRWEMFARLSETFTGTLAELVRAVDMVTGARAEGELLAAG